MSPEIDSALKLDTPVLGQLAETGIQTDLPQQESTTHNSSEAHASWPVAVQSVSPEQATRLLWQIPKPPVAIDGSKVKHNPLPPHSDALHCSKFPQLSGLLHAAGSHGGPSPTMRFALAVCIDSKAIEQKSKARFLQSGSQASLQQSGSIEHTIASQSGSSHPEKLLARTTSTYTRAKWPNLFSCQSGIKIHTHIVWKWW